MNQAAFGGNQNNNNNDEQVEGQAQAAAMNQPQPVQVRIGISSLENEQLLIEENKREEEMIDNLPQLKFRPKSSRESDGHRKKRQLDIDPECAICLEDMNMPV